jgi:DNA polymerase V
MISYIKSSTHPQTMLYALADCNNFYASCERCFNPALRNRPIVVLSNNDGCVIARSAEAKALGIKMGQAYFEIAVLCEEQGVKVFSSNFGLYGDLSNRVMTLLKQAFSELEVYSIDEAFLSVPKEMSQPQEFCQSLSLRVEQSTGIPLSIGIAKTKTLAKIANHVAKRRKRVFHLEENQREVILEATEIEEIWGIGRRLSKKLRSYGIKTALQLSCCDETWLLKKFNVNVLRTARELGGEVSLALETQTQAAQSIRVSRTFAQHVKTFDELEIALSQFTARAAEKLRAGGQRCQRVQVFVSAGCAGRSSVWQASFNLLNPSQFTPDLLRVVIYLAKQIYPLIPLKRAGVLLSQLCSEKAWQPSLFEPDRFKPPRRITYACDG